MRSLTPRPDGATSVALRPATAADEDFLRSVYGSTRDEELAATAWTDEQKAAFVAMQYAAQTSYYAEVYPDAEHAVIVVDGTDAGRFYLARLASEIRVVDISLLPEFRGRGVGTRLLTGILAEGGESGRRVVIHVEQQNPARALYDRLGFVPAEDLGIYTRMEWNPGAAS